jgi:transposase
VIVFDERGRGREIRWTARRKSRVVLQVLAGTSIDEAARDAGIPVSVVATWHDRFVQGGIDYLRGTPKTSRRLGGPAGPPSVP